MFDTQLACDDIHHADLSAVAVKQHHLSHAACGYTVANLAPHTDDRFSREGQRAGITAMLIALANGLRGEKQRVAFIRQTRDGFLDHAVHDCRVDCYRQMGTMLFNRTNRQNCHELLTIEA
ncbi:hypothetical protein D9M69_586990 [compost metagenome]